MTDQKLNIDGSPNRFGQVVGGGMMLAGVVVCSAALLLLGNTSLRASTQQSESLATQPIVVPVAHATKSGTSFITTADYNVFADETTESKITLIGGVPTDDSVWLTGRVLPPNQNR